MNNMSFLALPNFFFSFYLDMSRRGFEIVLNYFTIYSYVLHILFSFSLLVPYLDSGRFRGLDGSLNNPWDLVLRKNRILFLSL